MTTAACTSAAPTSTAAPAASAASARLPGSTTLTVSGPDQPQLPRETIAVRRTDRELQFGLGDDVAVTVPLPDGVSAEAMVELLQRLDGYTSPGEALERSDFEPTVAPAAAELLDSLVAAGVLRPEVGGEGGAAAPTFHVHILGRGDLAGRIETPLSYHGVHTTWSPRPGLGLDLQRPPWLRPRAADLVVLADDLVPDPLVLAALRHTDTPHVHVACRDGRVVVGPTVLPGQTSCLRCADLYRAARNPHWPRMSAQLLWTTGWAPLPTRVAGVALLLSEIAALRGGAGPDGLLTAGHTVEMSVSEGLWRRRRWEPHPDCGCGAAAATSGIVVA